MLETDGWLHLTGGTKSAREAWVKVQESCSVTRGSLRSISLGKSEGDFRPGRAESLRICHVALQQSQNVTLLPQSAAANCVGCCSAVAAIRMAAY